MEDRTFRLVTRCCKSCVAMCALYIALSASVPCEYTRGQVGYSHGPPRAIPKSHGKTHFELKARDRHHAL